MLQVKGLVTFIMQKRNEEEVDARAQTGNIEGKITEDTCWVVIKVWSAALKLTWRNYSALELDATCMVWSLETLAYYIMGCPEFDLWTDHSPMVKAMKKEIRELTPRMQKFRGRSKPIM